LIIPDARTQLKPEDEVVLLTHRDRLEDLKAQLTAAG
jgi:Trk K+ transport system NAD-binding subunit